MQRLKVKDLIIELNKMKKELNINEKEFGEMPVILGNDEELNGVHEAFFISVEDVDKAKNYTFTDVEKGKITFDEFCEQSTSQMIKDEDASLKGKVILIS